MYLCIFLIFVCIANVNCNIINTRITQTVDITTGIVRIKSVIDFENHNSSENVYKFAIDPDVSIHYVKFQAGNSVLNFTNEVNNSTAVYKINLNQIQTHQIVAELVILNKIVPLYKKISYRHNQYVSYKGNLYFYSPYTTLTLEKMYVLKNIDTLQKSHPAYQRDGDNLTYLFTNVDPFSYEETQIKFVNNKQFLVVTELKRVIALSHWGRICVQDKIKIQNEGSKLVGPYEPILSDISSSPWWYTYLAPTTMGIKYYDTIGNNSKSTIVELQSQKVLKFQPRYPLLGGWKTAYMINYCLHTYGYIGHSNELFVLKINPVDHILVDAVVKKVQVKILLPEGSKLIGTDIPHNFHEKECKGHFNIFCIFDRPTIVLTGSNVVEDYVDYLIVRYTFSNIYLLRVPLLFAGYVQFIFVIVMIVVRIKN